MGPHNLLDGIRSLQRMIKWDARSMMMQHMAINSTVENMSPDEAKVTVNS